MLRHVHSTLQRAFGTRLQRPNSSGALISPPFRRLSSSVVAASFSSLRDAWLSSQRRKQPPSEHDSHNPLPIPQFQVRYRSNRSRRGLYDGKDIRSGNNVSFSMKATKRKFKPNVFLKRVYSSVLDSMVPFHLTASTLRSIDKAGGLDHYLLSNPTVVEGEGLAIKKKILKRLRNQNRMARKEEERSASSFSTLEAAESDSSPLSSPVAATSASAAASASANP